MKFKVGTKVIAIANGVNYGLWYGESKYCHNYAKGWTGVVTEGDGLCVQFDNGRLIYGCDTNSFKEVNMKFKVGQKVRIKDDTKPKKYAGTTQEISEITNESVLSPYVYRMKGLPNSADGFLSFWRESELEPVEELKVGDKVKFVRNTCENNKHLLGKTGEITEDDGSAKWRYKTTISDNYWFDAEELELVEETKEETMDYKEALKAAIDGHKVQKECLNTTYVCFVGHQFRLRDDTDGYDEPYNLGDTGDRWKLYEEPKVQPKFTIDQTVVYRSNRLAKVTAVSDSSPYVYTLANPVNPQSVFKKTEDELREVE